MRIAVWTTTASDITTTAAGTTHATPSLGTATSGPVIEQESDHRREHGLATLSTLFSGAGRVRNAFRGGSTWHVRC
jgi:hypothetical protein